MTSWSWEIEEALAHFSADDFFDVVFAAFVKVLEEELVYVYVIGEGVFVDWLTLCTSCVFSTYSYLFVRRRAEFIHIVTFCCGRKVRR